MPYLEAARTHFDVGWSDVLVNVRNVNGCGFRPLNSRFVNRMCLSDERESTYGRLFRSASTIFIDVCGESAVQTFEFGWQTLTVASE